MTLAIVLILVGLTMFFYGSLRIAYKKGIIKGLDYRNNLLDVGKYNRGFKDGFEAGYSLSSTEFDELEDLL